LFGRVNGRTMGQGNISGRNTCSSSSVGGSLVDLIKLGRQHQRSLGDQRVRSYTRRIRRGLHYLHYEFAESEPVFELYQLNIKPSTLLFSDSREIIKIGCICDFRRRTPGDTWTARLGWGYTVGYAAPEVLSTVCGENVGPTADVWSLGIVVMEM